MARQTACIGHEAHAVVLTDLASSRVEFVVRSLELDEHDAAALRRAADALVLTATAAAGHALPDAQSRPKPWMMRPA